MFTGPVLDGGVSCISGHVLVDVASLRGLLASISNIPAKSTALSKNATGSALSCCCCAILVVASLADTTLFGL